MHPEAVTTETKTIYLQIVHKNMKITFCEWDTEGNFEQWLKENMKESD